MKTTADIKGIAQQVLDTCHDELIVSSSLANVCRVLAKVLTPQEDIDALPQNKRVAARQRALTRAQLLCIGWELDRVDGIAYTEQVVTGEPNE